MQSFELNKHGKIVFPANCFPDLDFSTFESIEQLDAVIRRDFDSKAPTGTDILERIKTGAYQTKFELMRDMALNLFWANRFKMTMYDVRPTRWADVPRSRDDIFIPIQTPWEDRETKVTAVQSAYPGLAAQWDAEVEDSIFEILFDVFGHRRNHATKLSAVVPTVAELLSDPGNQTLRLNRYDPDFRRYSYAEIIDCNEDVAELEALRRWSMVLHNQYPWSRSDAALTAVKELRDDDYVVVFHPRDLDVHLFLSRVASGHAPKKADPAAPEVSAPIRPYPALNVRKDLAVQPRIEAIAAVHGEVVCTNEDLIRNSAYNWSPMSADEISAKTGIEARRYTSDSLEELSLRAARSALAHAQVGPEQIGAVLVCTCTSDRLIPSVATWLSGQLGVQQTHCSFDLVAACAGLSYGLAEATRILQLVRRPVLVVCAEKFSNKIGNVRPSRMIFGDGAAAIVVGPAPEGSPPDIEYMQTYASGPTSQVNSILWPNPAFANNITVYRPRGEGARGALPHADARRHQGPAGPGWGRRVASGQRRTDHPAPGQQDHGDRPGEGRRSLPGSAVFQHRTGGQRLLGEHSAGNPRRGPRPGDHQADAGFRPRFRRRRGCGLRDSTDRSCRHRARRSGCTNGRVGRGSRARAQHARRGEYGRCVRITARFRLAFVPSGSCRPDRQYFVFGVEVSESRN